MSVFSDKEFYMLTMVKPIASADWRDKNGKREKAGLA